MCYWWILWSTPWFFIQFKLIQRAYEVLSDPEQRDIYDKGGEEAIKRRRSGQNFHREEASGTSTREGRMPPRGEGQARGGSGRDFHRGEEACGSSSTREERRPPTGEGGCRAQGGQCLNTHTGLRIPSNIILFMVMVFIVIFIILKLFASEETVQSFIRYIFDLFVFLMSFRPF